LSYATFSCLIWFKALLRHCTKRYAYYVTPPFMRLTRTTMSGAKARMKRLCTKRYAYYVTPPFMRLTRMTMSGAKARMKRLASLDMEHRADALFVSSPRRCLDLSFACHVALSGNLRRSRARWRCANA
jgi:hypothetical protein